jgi:hypothetical protein
VKTAQLVVDPSGPTVGDLAKQTKNVKLVVDSGPNDPTTPERRPGANSPSSARTIAYPVGGSSAAGGEGEPGVVLPTAREASLEATEMAAAFIRK